MSGRRRTLRSVVAVVLAVAALAACASDRSGPAEVSAASSASSPGTQRPVVAQTQSAAPRVGPVQGIIAPPPPVTTAPSPAGTTGAIGSGSSGSDDPTGFSWSSRTPSASDLGSSWREGCPVGPSSLRSVALTYYDMGGAVRTGTLIIHRDIESPTRRAFAALFDQRFPIASIRPVSEFDSDDDASMAANNTSAFNCRYAVTNPPSTTWSNHAYGRAIDVNPRTNPYVLDGEVLPPNGAEFADRGDQHPGGLYRGDAALEAFTANGFEWGGAWSDPDYQHLER